MNNAVFFHALDGTDVFLGIAETTKMVIKSRPKKYTDRCQIACTFDTSGKKDLRTLQFSTVW